jgi:hypothetical protein
VNWSAAHKHFLRWCRGGIWTRVLAAIHYEVILNAHEGFLILSQIAALLRRLDRSQLFNTL